MRDDLGNRMKQYEAVSSGQLLRRCPVIVRVDGRAFHTWTRGLDRPFDMRLITWMRKATEYAAVRMQGCKLAFTQSDEASFLLTDYDNLETQPWFGYDLAKVVSLSASTFTAGFNHTQTWTLPATFDARAFNIPADDVANYFLWRAKDWRRNAIQMVAQSLFSPKELHGVKINELQAMISAETGNQWQYSVPAGSVFGGWFLPRHLEWIAGPGPNFHEVNEVVELALRSMDRNGDGKMNDAANDVPGEQTADQEEAFAAEPYIRPVEPADQQLYPRFGMLSGKRDRPTLAELETLPPEVRRKVEEQLAPPEPPPQDVIDLMQALKDSLRVAAQESRRRDELAEERASRYTREDGTPK